VSRPVRVCRLVAVDGVDGVQEGMEVDEVLVPPAMLFNLMGGIHTETPR
jgi:hypothetical protein